MGVFSFKEKETSLKDAFLTMSLSTLDGPLPDPSMIRGSVPNQMMPRITPQPGELWEKTMYLIVTSNSPWCTTRLYLHLDSGPRPAVGIIIVCLEI